MRWRRAELPVALALTGIGFVVIIVSWVQASGLADVRAHLQLLLSGGFGGLGLILAGGAVLQSHVSARSMGDLRGQLDRVADALFELAAEARRPPHPTPAGADTGGDVIVLTTHASYHVQSCDLAAKRDDLRPAALAEARQSLQPCPVCIPTSGLSA